MSKFKNYFDKHIPNKLGVKVSLLTAKTHSVISLIFVFFFIFFVLEGKSCRMSDYLMLTIEPPRHGDIPRLGSRRPTLVRHIPPPETKRLKTDCDKCVLSRETKLKAIEEQKKTLKELRETQSKVLVRIIL